MIAQQNVRSACTAQSAHQYRLLFLPDALMEILNSALEYRRVPLRAKAHGDSLLAYLRILLRDLAEGKHEKTIQRLAAFIRQEDEPLAYLLLAAGYMLADEENCALTILDILLHSEPDYAEALVLQGVYLRWLNRRAEARPLLQRGVSLNPALCVGWRMLVEMAMEENQPEAALRYLREALRQARHPDPELLNLEQTLTDGAPSGELESSEGVLPCGVRSA